MRTRKITFGGNMEKENKPNAFKQALNISQGRSSFILAVGGMILCFVFAYLLPKGKSMNTAMMISGIVSVVACQQFTRILSVIRLHKDEEK